MRYLLIGLLIILSFNKTFSSESKKVTVQIKHPSGKNVSYGPGDVSTLVIQIWPVDNAFKEKTVKRIIPFLFPHVYIAEVLDAKFSRNNHEVLELKVTAMFLNGFDPVYTEEVVYDDFHLSVKYQKISRRSFEEETKSKDFIILDQVVETVFRVSKVTAFASIFLVLVLMLIVGKVLALFFRRRTVAKNKLEQFEKVKALFDNAESRDGIEKIYEAQMFWLKYSLDNQEASRLLNDIDEIMYMREWSSDAVSTLSERCFFVGNQLENV